MPHPRSPVRINPRPLPRRAQREVLQPAPEKHDLLDVRVRDGLRRVGRCRVRLVPLQDGLLVRVLGPVEEEFPDPGGKGAPGPLSCGDGV